MTDYELMLEELGVNQAQMDAMAAIDDLVDLPVGYNHLYVGQSIIEGLGMFTKIQINSGANICLARIGDKRTIAGRFVNHSSTPNTELAMKEDKIYMKASRDINPRDEITSDYRQTVKFRKKHNDL